MINELIKQDPLLKPYRTILERRFRLARKMERRLTGGHLPLEDWAAGHEFFGLHFKKGEWIFREWAPNASAVYLIGDFSGWKPRPEYSLSPCPEGVWEIHLPADRLRHQDLFRLNIMWPGGGGTRIPAYARWVVQDPDTFILNAQVWMPKDPYRWRHPAYRVPSAPRYVYEAHVGMAQEAERIGTYTEFAEHVLPRIKNAGYNTLQLMAIQEHPYYASFGYHVSSFFAPSSRFGTPDELKRLIDTAHGMGISVIMDLVHSHAVKNEVEGLSRFDGTPHLYFHDGPRGDHQAWDSRCFDYQKPQALHFLLSNCRYWLDEFNVDGFRMDGVTSMLYRHHGLGKAFTRYEDYFGDDVDEDAWTYLCLANQLIHAVRPDAVSIAEEVSGMPGLAAPTASGGAGFDYRFAMGIPDKWIALTKDVKDENWQMGRLWYELNNRRTDEKTISYAESHDQAIVGDQTLIMRLIGPDIYHKMRADDQSLSADRGMALHKMIRLITLACADAGYLCFMGNEFGHPEWIDFPRQGNNWSYKFARRQWHLADDPELRFNRLGRFDHDMLDMAKQYGLLTGSHPKLLKLHQDDKFLGFSRGDLLFVFNFHPRKSYTDYAIPVAGQNDYRLILDTDAVKYGGHGRLDPGEIHHCLTAGQSEGKIEKEAGKKEVRLYLPSRTALVLAKQENDS